jgi:sugar phosphate isomerase/epimerase
MGESGWRLSAFGDEISDNLQEQLTLLRLLDVGFLELRGAWGKNVLHLSDDEVTRVAQSCAAHGIAVSAIGSPIGKSPITQPLAQELANLERIFAIANQLGTRLVRVFSFYLPDPNEAVWSETQLVEEASARLAVMTQVASAEGIQLVLENEKGIVGDTIARCEMLLRNVNSPTLGFAWDPANFVHVGEGAPTVDGWAGLGSYTQHVHIKDLRMVMGEVVPAGEGDGQVDALLQRLDEASYTGFLALEPHLSFAGPSHGFSGEDGMRRAVMALRKLLASLGLQEERPEWAKDAKQ